MSEPQPSTTGNKPLVPSSGGGVNVVFRYGCYCVFVLGRPWHVALIKNVKNLAAITVRTHRAAYRRKYADSRQRSLRVIPLDVFDILNREKESEGHVQSSVGRNPAGTHPLVDWTSCGRCDLASGHAAVTLCPLAPPISRVGEFLAWRLTMLGKCP